MSENADKGQDSQNIYRTDGRVPLGKAIPMGLQHILAMFVANITPIIILANMCGIEQGLSARLVQNAMIVAGIGTLIQLFPIWRVGAKLPIVMGISFTFLSISIFIGTTYGYGALMGAVLVGGLIEGVLGLFAKYWIRLISPVVAATVVTAIGFSLLSVGANSFAGGQGAADFGAAHNWIVGSVTLVVSLGFSYFARGYLSLIAVLIGLAVGYVLSICLGMVDFSALSESKIIGLPAIMPFKFEFNLSAIVAISVIYLVSATETIGDSSAVCSTALDRDVTEKELSGSLACDGLVSSLASVFGCTPITSFSQNIGLVAMTKVVNRFAIGTGAAIMIIAGIFPIVGAVLTTVPQAVLGGCTIMMFGTIVISGVKMLSKCGFSERNVTISALSLSIGLGFTQVPKIFDHFPKLIQSVFAENCVATVFLLAIVLNLVLPKEKKQ